MKIRILFLLVLTGMAVAGSVAEASSSSTAYWPTGEIKSRTDENGLITSYAYSVDGSGRRVETVTRPDGSTEIMTYHLDGQVKSVTGTGVVSEHYSYTVASDGKVTTRNSVGSSSSVRYSERTEDWLGRTILEEKPAYTGTWQSVSAYNAAGQLASKSRTGLADLLFEYDDLGRQVRQGVDVNDNGSLDENSADVLSENVMDYTQSGGDWYERSTQKRWLTDASGTATTVAVVKNQVSGLSSTTLSHGISTDIYGGDTETTVTVNTSTKTVTSTSNVPESSIDVVQVMVNGRLTSQNSATVSASSSMEYDDLGRLESVTDAAGNTTTYTYYGDTQQVKTITPELGAVTEMTYKGQGVAGAGQVASRLTKDGSTTLSQIDYGYDALGRVTSEGGSGTYAKSYGYDSTYGDQTTLVAGGHTTTWTYQASTGLMTRKEYADSKGTDYTYYASGLLNTRAWERGVTTTYSYDDAGNLDGVDYSDSTPDVAYTVNRAGRTTAITDAAGTHALAYENDGQLASDAITSTGILSGYGVSSSQGSYGQRSSFTATGPSGTLTTHGYTYTNGRMATVAAHSQTVTYGYKTNTDLVETTTFNNGSSNIFTRTVAYDANYRIDQVTGTTSAGTVAKHDYSYDSRSRRTGVVREDSKTWTYGYNNKNEVESGVKKFSDSTNMPGHNFGFAYDSIGNRDSITLDGTTYEYGAVNSLNQLTTRVVPSNYTILGSAESDAKVIVNNRLADRKGEFWYKALTVDNDSSAAYLPVTIKGKLLGAGTSGEDVVAQQTGNLLVPETPETFVYDDDGNLTEDGLWSYTWDGENRLIQIQSASGVPAGAKKKLTFAYDAYSRRVQKKVYTWNSGTSAYDLQSTANFIYDGWNLAAETDGSGALTKTFAWGLDLSGSQQGAGGVGGLLVFRNVTGSKNYYAYSDGNGNVSKLVTGTTGAIAAEYEYSPFGEVLVQSGEASSINSIQWSSKYSDLETKLNYYGYRFYNPTAGKWINRDLIGERGGSNLYLFLCNSPQGLVDPFGNAPFEKIRVKDYIYNWDVDSPNWVNADASPGELHYTQHYIDIECAVDTTEIADTIYKDLETFRYFPGGLSITGSRAIFSLPGTSSVPGGSIISPIRVEFDKSLESKRTLQAVTIGYHPLIGVRKWSVRRLPWASSTLRIMTEAWEQTNFHALGQSPVGKVAMDVARPTIASPLQNNMWTDYLKAIGEQWKNKGFQVSTVSIGSGRTLPAGSTNPFRGDLDSSRAHSFFLSVLHKDFKGSYPSPQ